MLIVVMKKPLPAIYTNTAWVHTK